MLARIFEAIEPVELAPGVYQQELNRLDAMLEPDAWAFDRSGLYIYKPGLAHLAEKMGYRRGEAGSLFHTFLDTFLARAGVRAPLRELDRWARPLEINQEGFRYKAHIGTMYILGSGAVREAVRDDALGRRLTERRRALIETQLVQLGCICAAEQLELEF